MSDALEPSSRIVSEWNGAVAESVEPDRALHDISSLSSQTNDLKMYTGRFQAWYSARTCWLSARIM